MSSSNGVHEESISNLPVFFHNLQIVNPNTITKIKKDTSDRLEMCFISLGCVIRTFRRYMLPLVYVDCLPLKGEYLKTMFIALAMDGNHQELVLAFGVGGVETVESWNWFLRKLKKCLPNDAETGFISKIFGPIPTALESVFPDSYRGYCYRSVSMAFHDRYGFRTPLEMLLKETCKTYSMTDFQYNLSRLQNVIPGERVWLERFSCVKWARAFFPKVRWNVMTMDIPERIQRLAGERRSLPITYFIDVVLDDIKHTYLHRSEMFRSFGHITPYANNVLQRRIQKSQHWEVDHHRGFYFVVNDFRQTESLYLTTRICVCGKWQSSGIPCGHAIAALRFLNNMNFEEVVHILCTSETHRAAYATESVMPVPPPDQWQLPNEIIVLLPPM